MLENRKLVVEFLADNIAGEHNFLIPVCWFCFYSLSHTSFVRCLTRNDYGRLHGSVVGTCFVGVIDACLSVQVM